MDNIERTLLWLVGVLVLGTALAMWALWPGDPPAASGEVEPLYTAVIESAESYECPEPSEQADEDFFGASTGPCQRVTVSVLDGPAQGETFELDTGGQDYPEFSAGDRVQVGISSGGAQGDVQYYIADFVRLRPVLALFVIFGLAVLAVGRWHGLRSLAGLALSLVIIGVFVVPAILSGRSPFLVAIVGALAIMLVTLYLAHGLTLKTTAALVGTAAALGITVVLGLVFVELAQLTGFSSEEAIFARGAVAGLDLRGLVLAGLVIGALGVLDDVTVSQASTVFAVHDANPDQTWGAVFRRAMSVGRDHIASTVNTLVLAYVGASIPLVVLFSTSGLPAGEILNAEVVSEEVVKTLVGSIGLVSAVPLTTALATTVALRRSRTRPAPVPAHLGDDVDEGSLSEDEVAHRRWIEFLRYGPTDTDAPSVPGDDADDGGDDTGDDEEADTGDERDTPG